MADLDLAERRDRRFLLEHAATAGPVFGATAWGELWVCVVGTERCRRLLATHRDSLTPYTWDIASLVPGGFMRQMAGELHSTYRGRLVAALRATPLDAWRDPLIDAWSDTVEAHRLTDRAADPEALTRMLSDMATDSLAAFVLGAAPGTPLLAALRAGFAQMGARGAAWTIGEPQRQGFASISAALTAALDAGEVAQNSLLAHIHADGGLDDTMLGNLVYMVELGRMDVKAFLRWLLRFVVAEPAAVAEVREQPALAPAFVYEALRLEQSERLARVVDRAFRFDGRVIPKGTMLRLCMWESHKDPAVFADPFRFDLHRMEGPAADRRRTFSPFGLDHHVCPFESVAVTLVADALRLFVGRYRVEPVDDGPPVRGGYHFEPSPRFTVRFVPATATGGAST